MRIDINEIEADESKSNPMVTAMRYKHCPIGEVCMFMAVGGAIVGQCKHLAADGEDATCKYEDIK